MMPLLLFSKFKQAIQPFNLPNVLLLSALNTSEHRNGLDMINNIIV